MTERRAELGIVGDPIPEVWEETVAACLANDPALRPQSASDVQKRLQNSIPPSEIAAHATAKTVSKSIGKTRFPFRIPSPRNRSQWIIGILTVLALGLAIAFYSFHRPTEPRLGKFVVNTNPSKTKDLPGRSGFPTPPSSGAPSESPGKEDFLAVPTHSAEGNRTPMAEASPTPFATASPTPYVEANPNFAPATSSTPSVEVSPTSSADVSASVSPAQTAGSDEKPGATPPPEPLNQHDADATKEDVLRRINAMPGVTAEKKANLIEKMHKARSMERLAVVPFENGQSALRRAATDELVKMFGTPEMRDKLSDPTIVLVVAGYADSGGRPDANLRISQVRAENVGRILKEQVKLLNAMQTIGMGGTELLDSKRPDLNRAVEVWAVVPL